MTFPPLPNPDLLIFHEGRLPTVEEQKFDSYYSVTTLERLLRAYGAACAKAERERIVKFFECAEGDDFTKEVGKAIADAIRALEDE